MPLPQRCATLGEFPRCRCEPTNQNGVRRPADYAEATGVRPPGDPQFRPPGNAPRNGGVPGGSSVSPKTRLVAGVALRYLKTIREDANLQNVTGKCTSSGSRNQRRTLPPPVATAAKGPEGKLRHKRHAILPLPPKRAPLRARPLHTSGRNPSRAFDLAGSLACNERHQSSPDVVPPSHRRNAAQRR